MKKRMSLLQNLELFLKKNNLLKSKIAVAFSGGADSIALLSILIELKKIGKITDVLAIHVNHNLRETAKRDQNFCKNFCNNNKIEFYKYSVDVKIYSKQNSISVEEAGRLIRYEKFNEILERTNFDFIATAHHRDDVVESFFINLFKGTGLRGASAISSRLSSNIIRPMLNISKNEIYNYLENNNIEFVVDETNFESKYYRNIIRNDIVPIIKKLEPNFEKKVVSFIKISKEIDEYLSVTENLEPKKDIFNNDYIPRKELLNLFPSIIYYRLKNQFYKWGLSEDRTQIWENIYKLIETKSTGIIPLKNNNFVCIDSDGIRKKVEFKRSELTINKEFKSGFFFTIGNEFKITLKKTDKKTYFVSASSLKLDLNDEFELDSEKFPYKLSYRFNGVKNLKGKKIKDIFIKKRVPMSYKDFWPLVLNSDNVVHKILFIKRWS